MHRVLLGLLMLSVVVHATAGQDAERERQKTQQMLSKMSPKVREMYERMVKANCEMGAKDAHESVAAVQKGDMVTYARINREAHQFGLIPGIMLESWAYLQELSKISPIDPAQEQTLAYEHCIAIYHGEDNAVLKPPKPTGR